MSRLTKNDNTIIGSDSLDQRLKRVEQIVSFFEGRLATMFIKGRLRTDRTAPISSADVQSPDRLYDIVRDGSYEYVLINNGGALAWRRIAMNSF